MLVKKSSATRAVILRLVIAVAVTTVGACAATENPFNGACGIQVRVPPPTGTRFAADQVTAMSPDGSTLVFEAVGSGGVRRLWAYSMRTAISRQISGSEEGRFPFWSPDGSELGFFSQGQIKRTNLTLDGVTVVCEECDGREGTWNRHGLILFASAATNGIHGVNTAGGMPPVQITTPDARSGETAHRWPLFLPDGVHFVYTAWGKGPHPAHEAYLGSIRSPEKVPVNLNGKRAAYHDP